VYWSTIAFPAEVNWLAQTKELIAAV
jgi:hypothetical protein